MHLFSFHCYRHPPDLHSFPTRRSSDLARPTARLIKSFLTPRRRSSLDRMALGGASNTTTSPRLTSRSLKTRFVEKGTRIRSEEHTSELQSHSDLVCRLLLEKKKNNKQK